MSGLYFPEKIDFTLNLFGHKIPFISIKYYPSVDTPKSHTDSKKRFIRFLQSIKLQGNTHQAFFLFVIIIYASAVFISLLLHIPYYLCIQTHKS